MIVDPYAARNRLIAAFRRKVYEQNGVTWFPHQAEWQLASEGTSLLPIPATLGQPHTVVLLPESELLPAEQPIGRTAINDIPCVQVRRVVVPRPGGIAHNVTDLAGYKGGKSFGGALWLSGFAVVPYKVHLIGFEYSTSEPEFDYLCEFLLSERGMNMRPVKYLNDRRQGRMLIVLPTGASYEVKTWERKEALKGKKVICYYYAEAYQLPGLECFTTVAQNLRELRGWAAFTTTPDKPWVGVLHDQGHGHDPDWHCSCENDARCNPYTYDKRARDRDDPEQGGIMTRERFAIAWQGKLGHFVGRVYDVARGQRHATPLTHPLLWKPELVAAMLEREGVIDVA
jgi:hypothetical protein